ncbi:MAG: hypothetical protein BWY52_00877 [Chloroflexi bacterium ADurb.Bin325]|nr:MAG: hypothetical protein BWY52_00877 [Chloroflexi bacterium ADurb.Bin325]
MRANGIGFTAIVRPLLVVAGLMALAVAAINEFYAPHAAEQARAMRENRFQPLADTEILNLPYYNQQAGRVWRIVERVLDSELTGTPNTARNAVSRLAERGLLADYEQHGKPVGWAYKAGGTRRLVQLTPMGRQWCQAAFGLEPVESEIAVAALRHKSISHGVAILEAAHLLAAAGYDVDDDPQALLADDAAPWHARAEPDLAFLLQDEWWPVEVQREVSPRVVAKWAKSLELCERLALVLYHEEARKKQAAILTAARFRLPRGVIWLASLEQMERGAWTWQEITTTGS